MRDLFFSSHLAKGWESWAVRQALGVQTIAVLAGVAISFAIDLFAVFIVVVGVFGWFRYRQYTSVNAMIIGAGCALTFIGVHVAINGVPLALTTAAAGCFVVVRFFSEGPALAVTVTVPPKKVTKKKKKRKRGPSS